VEDDFMRRTIRPDQKTIDAALTRVENDVAGVSDNIGLTRAADTAEELTRIEVNEGRRLRFADVAQAAKHTGASPAQTATMVMAYLAAKYPDLADRLKQNALERDLGRQFAMMMGTTKGKEGMRRLAVNAHDIPAKILKGFMHFFGPSMTTGLSVSQIIGTPEKLGLDARADVISIRGSKAFLTISVDEEGVVELARVGKTAATHDVGEPIEMNDLSGQALKELSDFIANGTEIPKKPTGNPQLVKRWEQEHEWTQGLVEHVVRWLSAAHSTRRAQVEGEAARTSPEFAPALDAHFENVGSASDKAQRET
jgi:hypothetical protein